MPKLKQYDADHFEITIKHNKIKFANNPAQPTYIKNRVDRILTKEPETIKWLDTHKPNSIFFDVGANIGIYSMYSAMVNNNKTFAFEPHAPTYKNLLDTINLNTNCRAWCVALGDDLQFTDIAIKNLHEGVADNIVGETGEYLHGCITIPMDMMMRWHLLPQPDYIKIDVDGYEDKVIVGAKQTFKNAKSLLIEIDRKHICWIDQIKDWGFELTGIHKRNEEENNYIFENVRNSRMYK
tara:strand:+ start:3555 stop:4268 length:714 start_codon:yes stop_codon:yes gene_type:complete